VHDEGQAALEPAGPDVVNALVASHRRFLAFLERRVGSRDSAEEILQAAYARALEKGVPADEAGGAVSWFFTVLRNAVTDHHRHRAAQIRARAALAAETPPLSDPELRAEICVCFRTLLPTLRPEYATILERVDLAERPVSEVASELGITPNNASVRLHRARAALRAQLQRSCGICAAHGCLDCRCERRAR